MPLYSRLIILSIWFATMAPVFSGEGLVHQKLQKLGVPQEYVTGVVVDDTGHIYVTGYTRLSDFPTTPGSFDPSYNGERDVFLLKLSPDGNTLIYSTYIGSPSADQAFDLAVDDQGRVWVTGTSSSSDFPITTDALSSDSANRTWLCRISSDGSSLEYSTFLIRAGLPVSLALQGSNLVLAGNYSADSGMGFANDEIAVTSLDLASGTPALRFNRLYGVFSQFCLEYVGGMAVAPTGEIYVGGSTTCSWVLGNDNGLFGGYSDEEEGIVYVLDAKGDLLSEAYVGGSSDDKITDMALDSEGNLYLIGETLASDFPTANALDWFFNGGRDAFLIKTNGAFDTVFYSTFLGGVSTDRATSLAVTADGMAFVTGNTSVAFPTTANPADPDIERGEGYVAAVAADGQSLHYATYLGGSQNEEELGIAVDTQGNAYAVGLTFSTDFPMAPASGSNAAEIFAAKLNPTGTALDYATLVSDFRCTPPWFTLQPQRATLCEGEPLSLSVAVSNGGFVSYQWYLNGNPIDGATEAEYSLTGVGLEDAGTYFCRASNACETLDSDTAIVKVDNDFVVANPQNQNSCLGYQVVISIRAIAGTITSVQWYKDNQPIVNAVAQALILRNVTQDDEALYHADVRGSCGQVITAPAVLRLFTNLPAITPPAQSLGLEIPRFGLNLICDGDVVDISWSADPPTPMIPNGHGIILDPPPTQNTVFEVSVNDSQGRATTATSALLAPVFPGYLDYNGDGCNNLWDLWDLALNWNENFPNDPDNNNFLDVRDLLYLNLDDPLTCL